MILKEYFLGGGGTPQIAERRQAFRLALVSAHPERRCE